MSQFKIQSVEDETKPSDASKTQKQNLGNYSEEMLVALNALSMVIAEYQSRGAGIAEGPKKKYGKNISYWTFLNNIELSKSSTRLFKNIDIENNLSIFSSTYCNGSVDTTINEIHNLIRRLQQQLEQKLTKKSFIKQVYLSDTRNEHTHHNNKINEYNSLVKEISELDIAINELQQTFLFIKEFRAVFKSSQVSPYRSEKASKKGKRQSELAFAGECLLCHRPNYQDEHYCELHTKPRKNEIKKDKSKRGKEIINSAFENLGYALPVELSFYEENPHIKDIIFPSTYGISNKTKPLDKHHKNKLKEHLKKKNINDKDILILKTAFLRGWAKYHSDNQVFIKDIFEIERHIFSATEWSQVSIEQLKKLNDECQKHIKNIKSIDLSVFSNDIEILEMQNKVLGGGIENILQPFEFVHHIKLLNLYNIIKTAADKKTIQKEEDTIYKSDLLLRNILKP